jgi:predicted  nucleic acid-binding Zn-ribbon protein
MKHRSLSLGFFLLALAVVCSAQTQDTANKDSSGAKPAAPADKSAPKQDAPATPEKKKPKKVWTNDEVATLPGQVSVVGQPNQRVEYRRETEEGSSSDKGNGQESQIDSYRQQIGDLRNQIDAADQRIAELKNFKGENASPTGGINPNKGYNMVPVEEQIKQLEAKKKKLQGQIDDLENEARKNGIDPGKLR